MAKLITLLLLIGHSLSDPQVCNLYELCDAQSETCKNNGICECRDGYHIGTNNCQDDEECKGNVCDENAVCTEMKGSFLCQCSEGFYGNGTSCIKKGPCFTKPCQQKCSEENQKYTCSCNDGLTLKDDKINCESQNKCQSADVCKPPAYCVVSNKNEECVCPQGYTLDDSKQSCHKDVCSTSSCDVDTTDCIGVGDKYHCRCKAGYYRPHQMTDPNFCLKKTTCVEDCAQPGGECVLKDGDYKCVCRVGYVKDGSTCKAKDVCKEASICGKKNAVCYPTFDVNELECGCHPGFTFADGTSYCEYYYKALYKGVITMGFPSSLSSNLDVSEKENMIRKTLVTTISDFFLGYEVYVKVDLLSGVTMLYLVDIRATKALLVGEINNKLNEECMKNMYIPREVSSKEYCILGSVIVELPIKPAFSYNPCEDIVNNCNDIIHDCVSQSDPRNGMYCKCKSLFERTGQAYNTEICEEKTSKYCDVYPPLCTNQLQECVELPGGYECRCIKGTVLGTNNKCVDICHNVTCFNNGECVDGLCVCPDEFIGKNCESFNPYSKEFSDIVKNTRTLSIAMGIFIMIFLITLVYIIERKCKTTIPIDSETDVTISEPTSSSIQY